MQLEKLDGLYQLKQFGIFFLGVAVGVFVTIILFFYGCFKSSTTSLSSRSSRNQDSDSSYTTTDENLESQMPPPSYSSLRFDKKPCKPCKCCRIISCKNIFKK